MSDTLFIVFSGVKRDFDIKFVKKLVKVVLGNEIKYNEKLIANLYNTGRGSTIFIDTPLYKEFQITLSYLKGEVHVSFGLTQWFFRDYRVGSEEAVFRICDDLVERCVAAYNFVKPLHGYGDWGGVIDENWGKEKDFTKNFYWLNFYGHELVEKVGREKLMNLPKQFSNCTIHKLANRGILLKLARIPSVSNELIENVRKYLYEK